MAKTFIDEFGIVEEEVTVEDIPDYETFTNKELLDENGEKTCDILGEDLQILFE